MTRLRGDRLWVRTFFTVVAVAAGATGVVLVAAPGSTDRYFSWTLRPSAAASLIGGLYLASAVVFGFGVTLDQRGARALLVGVLGLALPTLVLSLVHDEVFDFGRWQALAWMALFLAAPLVAAALLRGGGSANVGAPGPGPGPGLAPLPPWCRAALGLFALIAAVLALVICFDGTRDDVSGGSPVDLIGLTGAYLGAWCSFLATISGFAAFTNDLAAARVAVVTVAAASVGAMVGLLRTAADLRHPVLSILILAAVAAAAAGLRVPKVV